MSRIRSKNPVLRRALESIRAHNATSVGSGSVSSEARNAAYSVKQVVVLCTLVLGLVCLTSLLSYRHSAKAMRDKAERHLAQELRTVKAGIVEAISTLIQTMELWTQRPVMVQILEEDLDHEVADLLDTTLEQFPDLTEIACFTANGKLLAWSGSAQGDQQISLPREVLHEIRHGRRAVIATVGRNSAIAVPILWQFDELELLGVLQATVTPRAFLKDNAGWWAGLVTAAGRTLHQLGPALPRQIALHKMEHTYPGVGRVAHRSALVELPAGVEGPDLYAVIADEQATLFDRTAVFQTMVMSTAGAIVILLLVMAFVRRQRSLVNRLAEHAEQLEEMTTALQSEVEKRKKAQNAQSRLLREVESINGELKDFAYVVSHDLKAPLRAIGSLANWISLDHAHKLDEDGKEQINLLVSRVKRMHNLIEGILLYSRVGRIREDTQEVCLQALVEDVVDMIDPPDSITVTIKDTMPRIVCERTRIAQVFQNLISNAVKYMDKQQGEISITCSRDDDYWRFGVSDNGPGIEDQHFERIFKVFQTLSPRDEIESTGIGLSLVRKIVEMYGGRVWLKSIVGQGTTFHFTLPETTTPTRTELTLEVENAEPEIHSAC